MDLTTRSAILDSQVVVTLRGLSPDHVPPAVEALVRGGLRTIEITLNSPEPFRTLRAVRERFGDRVLLGAGTVIEEKAATASLQAGAAFLVAPSVEESVATVARAAGAVAILGAATATEILRAWRAGSDIVKVFPAGGPDHIRFLRGPLDQIPLMPTGGVTSANASAYLRAGAAVIGVGVSVVNPDLAKAGAFDEIERRARAVVDAVAEARS